MSLFLGKLPIDIKWNDLHSIFRNFGKNYVDIKGGYGFVDFEKSEDAEAALKESSRVCVRGQSILVQRSKVQQHRYSKRSPRGSRFSEPYKRRKFAETEDYAPGVGASVRVSPFLRQDMDVATQHRRYTFENSRMVDRYYGNDRRGEDENHYRSTPHISVARGSSRKISRQDHIFHASRHEADSLHRERALNRITWGPNDEGLGHGMDDILDRAKGHRRNNIENGFESLMADKSYGYDRRGQGEIHYRPTPHHLFARESSREISRRNHIVDASRRAADSENILARNDHWRGRDVDPRDNRRFKRARPASGGRSDLTIKCPPRFSKKDAASLGNTERSIPVRDETPLSADRMESQRKRPRSKWRSKSRSSSSSL